MGRRTPGGALLLLLACFYALFLGGSFYTSDGDVMFHTTESLVRRGTLAVQPDPALPQIVAGQNGRWYGKYDPGLPLIAAPFFALGDALADINHAHRTALAALVVLLAPVLAAAGAAAITGVLAGDLFGARRGIGIALIAGIASPLWPYARTLFPEAILACALAGAVALAVHAARRGDPRVRDWIAVGAVFGVGMLVRAAFATYALPLAILVLSARAVPDIRAAIRRLAALGIGVLPFALGLLAHNALRFGDPFRFGYPGEGFTTPPWEGIAGLLFSPGKSVFLYAPPLILAAILWPRFRRAQPALGGFLAAAWIVALAFYGSWWAWGGGWCWGPRFLVPLIPLGLLPLGMLPAARGWRIAAAALVALGIAAQIVSTRVDVTLYYAVGEAAGVNSNHAWVAPGDAPLVWAADELAAGQTEPLALFHLGDLGLPPTWSVGVPLLCAAGIALGAWRIRMAIRSG
ncbi:glycosyltransferase family 39 protein [Aggregatilinea lenta]|uniref:glycosyltransferase family 39 protein n=1 Tax=Aggregatilinea lenta TaxID=913108 RepID=UPI0013C2FD2F|nr:glycosyltransferase family 39 protein [Aggregatilinea lenta]